jgi:hypothetical protein
MNILKLSKVAQDYYESTRGKTLYSGYEKNILTDGERCLFVKSDYEPAAGEVIFRCRTINQNTVIDLYKKGEKK